MGPPDPSEDRRAPPALVQTFLVGSHTLVIEVTGTANASSSAAFVVVDAFDATLDGAGLLPPIP
jgi:hypothetical protein